MFIPLAEQHELIIPLTRYLMNTVTENLQLFPPRPSFYISINVAAEHFKTLNIIDDIRQIWLPAPDALIDAGADRTHRAVGDPV